MVWCGVVWLVWCGSSLSKAPDIPSIEPSVYQKSPIHYQKSPIHYHSINIEPSVYQKSPIYYHSIKRALSLSKEPYTLSKEPECLRKEPKQSVKKALHHRHDVCQLSRMSGKRALQSLKRDLQSVKRAIWRMKRGFEGRRSRHQTKLYSHVTFTCDMTHSFVN